MKTEAEVRIRLNEVRHLHQRYIEENVAMAAESQEASAAYVEQITRYRAAEWTLEWVLDEKP